MVHRAAGTLSWSCVGAAAGAASSVAGDGVAAVGGGSTGWANTWTGETMMPWMLHEGLANKWCCLQSLGGRKISY